MRFEIHYTINGYEDNIIIEGENVEDIKKKVDTEFEARGLDPDKNNAWSEEID